MAISTEVTIALPFSIDAYGRVTQTTDQSKIWADKVRSVIGTAYRERVMRPLFGADIPTAMFENQEEAEGIVQELVTTAFASQLEKLALTSISTFYDDYTNTLNVEIVYALPNEEIVTTTIGLIAISGNQIPFEENL